MAINMACWLAKLVYGREICAISFSLLVCVLTNIANVDFGGVLPAWRFAASYLTGALCGNFVRGPNISLLSQLIGPHDKAPYMGLLFAVGALPRVLGPTLMVELLTLPAPLRQADFEDVYSGPMPRTWLLYGTQALLFLTILILLAFARKPIWEHLQRLRTLVNLSMPLLPDKEADVEGASTPCRFHNEALQLPNTPVGVREGICDLAPALSRTSSLGLQSFEESPCVRIT